MVASYGALVSRGSGKTRSGITENQIMIEKLIKYCSLLLGGETRAFSRGYNQKCANNTFGGDGGCPMDVLRLTRRVLVAGKVEGRTILLIA